MTGFPDSLSAHLWRAFLYFESIFLYELSSLTCVAAGHLEIAVNLADGLARLLARLESADTLVYEPVHTIWARAKAHGAIVGLGGLTSHLHALRDAGWSTLLVDCGSEGQRGAKNDGYEVFHLPDLGLGFCKRKNLSKIWLVFHPHF